MPITPYFLSMAISGGQASTFLDGGAVDTSIYSGREGIFTAPTSAFFTDPTTNQQTAIFTLLIPATSNNVLDQFNGAKQENFTPEYKGYGFGEAVPIITQTGAAGGTTLQSVSARIPPAEYPGAEFADLVGTVPADDAGLVVGFDLAEGFSINDSMTQAQSASVTFAIYNNLTRRSTFFTFHSAGNFGEPGEVLPQNQQTNTGLLTGLYGWGYDAVPQELRGNLHRPGYV